jgi:hypothetical protein
MGLALGVVNVLFLSFVAVQVGYLFGGASHLLRTAGLTAAEYARRGFFELTAVSALVLPMLLAAHALVRPSDRGHLRLYRVMSVTMLGLLAAIMTSALARMRLYTEAFGLTESRLYATAFMLWLALVFVWFAATVLRGRAERFPTGALVAGLGMLGMLHVANPDALIVRVNAARAAAGLPFDSSYVTGLSDDAVPALLEALPALPADARLAIAKRLTARSRTPAWNRADWRSWNWGRAHARTALAARLDAIRGALSGAPGAGGVAIAP